MNVGAEHTRATWRIGVFVLCLIALYSSTPSTFAFTIQVDETGGECTHIGSWNMETKTCTLTGDATGTLSVVGNGLYPSRTEGITIDGAGYTLAGDGTGIGFSAEGWALGLTLKNITLNHFQTGISLKSTNQTNDDTKGVRVENVRITDTPSGFLGSHDHHTRMENLSIDGAQSVLQTGGSKDFSLRGLTATNVPRTTPTGNNSGILIGFDTEHASLEDITMSGDTDPLVLQNARNIRLRNIRIDGYPINLGRIDGTQHGTFFQMEGRELAEYTHDIDDSVTVNGKPVRYFLNRSNETFDIGSAAALICISCDHVTIQNADIAHTHRSILLYHTKNSTLQNATATEAIYGIALYGSTDNTLTQNTLGENWHDVSLQPSMKQIGWNYGPVFGSDIQSTGNVFSRNTFTDTAQNPPSVSDGTAQTNPNANTYSFPLPQGGNYWASFDEPSEGCTDENTDGLCDDPYHLLNAQGGTLLDEHPWVSPQAWQQATGTPPVSTSTCTDHCVSSVAFLPGLEASRLYVQDGGEEKKIWEPDRLSFRVDDLLLDANGESIRSDVYTRDVVDTAHISTLGVSFATQEIYGPFLNLLTRLRAEGIINDFRALPYDWRKSVERTISEPVHYEHELQMLTASLEDLAKTSKTGKVTIVAHSFGGLVAKELLTALDMVGKAHLVDKVIFVAVPHLGTPKAAAGLLHGAGQQIPEGLGFIVSQAEARQLGEHMPSAYALMPSKEYFTVTGSTPVLNFTHVPEIGTVSGVSDLVADTYDEMHAFLTTGRSDPSVGDTRAANLLPVSLVDAAQATHNTLDDWSPPTGVTAVNLVGWGLDTVSGLVYRGIYHIDCGLFLNDCDARLLGYKPRLAVTQEGDFTVTGASAAHGGWGTEYFDMALFREREDNATIAHGDMFTADPVLSFIEQRLKHLDQPISYISPNPPPLLDRVYLEMQSPVDIMVTDREGRRAGLVHEDGTKHVIIEIPGATYQQIGEEKLLGLPAHTAFTASLTGTDEGSFTFTVSQTQGGMETARATFAEIPVTENLSGTLAIPAVVAETGLLALDENGDGNPDMEITPEITGAVVTPENHLARMRTAINAMSISDVVRANLLHRLDTIIGQLSARADMVTNRSEARSEREATYQANINTRFEGIAAYLATLVAKPEKRARRITPEVHQTLTAAFTLLERTLADLSATTTDEMLTQTKDTIRSLTLDPNITDQLLKKADNAGAYRATFLEHLAAFDENTEEKYANHTARIHRTIDNILTYAEKLAARPEKRERRLTSAQYEELVRLLETLGNLVE